MYTPINIITSVVESITSVSYTHLIFIKLGLKAAENKGWRIREAIEYKRRKCFEKRKEY